jgi:Uma2 family endonuclease
VDINEPAVPALHQAVSIRPLSVADYHKMGEAGIFGEYERVELIEGQLVSMPPIHSRHIAAVNVLTRVLVRAVEDRAIVSVQNPVRLNDRTEPEPDLALLQPRADDYRSATPGPRDVLLIIEVAASSIDYDRGVKRALYARHGIPEFWIADLDSARVEVYRSPEPDLGRYGSLSYIGPDGSLDVAGLPGVVVPVSSIFG